MSLLVGGFVLAPSAWAVPLQIFDCDGASRAVKDVQEASKTDVKMDVSSQQGNLNGTNVTLTNQATGEVRIAPASNGVVVFPELTPGNWILGTSSSDLFFSSIIIEEPIAPALAVGVGGGAAAAGVAVVGIGINEIHNRNNSDNNSNPTPLPTPIPTVQPTPTICMDCNPDEDAEEINNFFDSSKTNGQQTPAANTTSAKTNPHASSANNCLNDSEVPPLSQFE